MSRTTRLLVACLCVAGLVVAWFSSRPSPPEATRRFPEARALPGDDAPPMRRERARESESPVAPPATPNRFGRLVVHVASYEDDAPIAGARVRGFGDRAAAGTTGAQGDVALDIPIDADAERADEWLDVTAPGRVRGSVKATVAPGAEQREKVRLSAGFAVDGVVRDAAGRPVSGARVVAQEAGGCITPYPEVASAESDAEGRFHVDGLPFDSRIRYEVKSPRHVMRAIHRRPHDTAPLDVRLESGGVIRGVVRSPDGDPVAGARVTPSFVNAEAREEDWFEEAAWTGDDGRFEVGSLPLGRTWTVSAWHKDFMSAPASGRIPIDAAHPEGAAELRLRPAARVEVDFEIAPGHAATTARLHADGEGPEECAVPGRATFVVGAECRFSIAACAPGLRLGAAECDVVSGETKHLRIRFVEGASISGFIVDDAGAAVAGAVVTVDKNRDAMQSAVSGGDGAFVVRGLEEAPHAVLVEAVGHAESLTEVRAPAEGVRLVVPRFGEAVLRLRLPDGAPVPATRRIHWNDYPNVAEDAGPWTGSEVVRSLPPGEWLLDVDVEGFVPVGRSGIRTLSGQRTIVDEIALDPGLPLAGRLVDVEGRGVARATVFVDLQLLTTDAEGRFGVAHAAPGPHDVRAKFHPDFLDAEAEYEVSKDATPLVLTLRRGAVLRVLVRGATDEDLEVTAPPADAAACGEDTGDLGRLENEEPGRWSARLPAGAAQLRVRRDGVTLATRNLDLREGGDVTVEIELPK